MGLPSLNRKASPSFSFTTMPSKSEISFEKTFSTLDEKEIVVLNELLDKLRGWLGLRIDLLDHSEYPSRFGC